MGFVKLLSISVLVFLATVSFAEEDKELPKQLPWSFEGALGSFDRESIQRGFKVYKEVCSTCHSLKRVAFRNLQDIGFNDEEVKSIAAGYNIQDGPNEEGEMFERPGRPSDRFPLAYPNDNAARAANNNNALPPDLSLIIKARFDGANYVYSLLTGYQDAPKDFQLGENMYYNPYFSGGGKQFSMPPPLLKDGQVQFDDGTASTVDQMSKDVVNFLQWAAEPEMEQRKGLGVKVIIFTIIFTFFFYVAKKVIWRNVK